MTPRCKTCRNHTTSTTGICRPCRDQIPLRGGAWVPTGRGTVVWRAGTIHAAAAAESEER